MKKRVLIHFSFLLTLGLIISSCGETEIEKANSEYDWKATPEVIGVNGPSSVLQTFSEWYEVSYYRGGSSWDWSVLDGGATINADSTKENGRMVYVTFTEAGQAVLSVTETTGQDVKSEPYNDTITVNPFCPVTDFSGSWSGNETGDSEGAITLNFVATASPTVYLLEATAGTPALLSGVFLGWGETFQAGFGDEGNIYITVNPNGSVEFAAGTYWGQTLPGPYDYWYFGSGNWDGCTASPTMSFSFNLDWSNDGSSARSSTVTLTKD